jgi:hypothetical protein
MHQQRADALDRRFDFFIHVQFLYLFLTETSPCHAKPRPAMPSLAEPSPAGPSPASKMPLVEFTCSKFLFVIFPGGLLRLLNALVVRPIDFKSKSGSAVATAITPSDAQNFEQSLYFSNYLGFISAPLVEISEQQDMTSLAPPANCGH